VPFCGAVAAKSVLMRWTWGLPRASSSAAMPIVDFDRGRRDTGWIGRSVSEAGDKFTKRVSAAESLLLFCDLLGESSGGVGSLVGFWNTSLAFRGVSTGFESVLLSFKSIMTGYWSTGPRDSAGGMPWLESESVVSAPNSRAREMPSSSTMGDGGHIAVMQNPGRSRRCLSFQSWWERHYRFLRKPSWWTPIPRASI
jgi:hypothetical protein